MATYPTGANGAFPGKLGSMIGSNWRSINLLKGLSKKSSKPIIELQLAQRSKFASPSVRRVKRSVLRIQGIKSIHRLFFINQFVEPFGTLRTDREI